MDKPWRLSLIGLVLVFGLVNAVPYSKYGRSCKDIGCRSNEVCVMAEDPCTLYSRDQCGRYPTCTRATDGMSCTTMICPTGQYCKTMNGRPTCVNTSPNLAPAARRPGGSRQPVVIPTPPPRTSSFGFGGRYPSNSGNSIGTNGGSSWNYGRREGNTHRQGGGGSSTNNNGGNYYNTHVSVDSRGNRVWTFSG